MERSCYRCGASLESEAPFCPSCGAAQIRVTADQPARPQAQSNLDSDLLGPESHSPPAAASEPTVQFSGQIQQKSLLPIVWPLALLAGIVCFLSPLLGWFTLIGITVWAVFRYQLKSGGISAGAGARLGAVMGLLTFVFFLLVGALNVGLTMLRHQSNELRETMVKQIQQMAARNPDPRAQEILRWFTTNDGLMVLLALSLFFFFMFILVSATATGAVAGALGNKKPQQ